MRDDCTLLSQNELSQVTVAYQVYDFTSYSQSGLDVATDPWGVKVERVEV